MSVTEKSISTLAERESDNTDNGAESLIRGLIQKNSLKRLQKTETANKKLL